MLRSAALLLLACLSAWVVLHERPVQIMFEAVTDAATLPSRPAAPTALPNCGVGGVITYSSTSHSFVRCLSTASQWNLQFGAAAR